MKIAYILPTLEVNGGAERIITEKANYLATHYNYDICIICVYQHDNSSNFYPLSQKVQQYNLKVPYFSQYKYKYPKRLLKKIQLNMLICKRLSMAVQKINPDILIGTSSFRADTVCKIPCNSAKLIECHEPRELFTSNIYNKSIFSKLYSKIHESYYYHIIEKKADIIVNLTNEARDSWKNGKRIEVIPNFSSMNVVHHTNCKSKRVIAVGRLSKEKGFERLLCIWKTVSDKYPDWQLDIFGEGSLKEELANIINNNHIKNVALCGSTQNISKEYATSSICAVSSYYEGFSLVILEAMKHGVPCIAFDCQYGPRNIILNTINGYIIENENNTLYSEKLCTLINNDTLREEFSKAAIKRSEDFNIDSIMHKWNTLFEEINSKNLVKKLKHKAYAE